MKPQPERALRAVYSKRLFFYEELLQNGKREKKNSHSLLFYFKKMQTTLRNQRLATILGTIFKIVNQNRKDLNTYIV